MPILERNGEIVTEIHKVPVKEIIHAMCESRSMARITNKYPLTEDELWDAVDAYVDLVNYTSIADIEFTDFDHNDVGNPEYMIEVSMITEEMFATLIRFGRIFTHDSDDLDYLYQLGLYHVIVDVLEYMMAHDADDDPEYDLLNNSDMHFSVLTALESAYRGNLNSECGFFLKHMRASGEPAYEQ